MLEGDNNAMDMSLSDGRYNNAISALTYGFNCLVLDPRHNRLHDCILSIHEAYINIVHVIIARRVSYLLKLHQIYNITDNEFSTEAKLREFGIQHYLILYTQSLDSFTFSFKTEFEKETFRVGMVLMVRQAKLYYDRLNEFDPFKAEAMMTFLHADKDGGNLLDIEQISSILAEMKINREQDQILRDIEQIDKILFEQQKLRRPKGMKNSQLNELGFQYLLRFYTVKDDLLRYFCNYCSQFKPKVRSNKVSIIDVVRYNEAPIMSASQLRDFYERVLFEQVTEEFCLKLIGSFPVYDQQGRERAERLEMISFNNFCSLISSRRNSAYLQEKKELYQKMTNPITDYYISSDFSDYSLNNSKNEIKINHFELSLKRGTRCLHLHLSEDKTGQPVIAQGLLPFTSLEEILKIIALKGFEFNKFPILLRIEQEGVRKGALELAARIIKKVFEDQLFVVPNNYLQQQTLPAPAELLNKVLIMANVNPKLFRAKEKDFPEESWQFFRVVSLFWSKLDFERKGQFGWNFCIMQDDKVHKLEEVQDENMSNYTKKLLIKAGPTADKGEEINRSTSTYLRLGIQLIGLTFKRVNEENYILQSLFLENGGPKSGYLLKPSWMCLKNPKNLYAKNFDLPLFTLAVKVVAGQNCIINELGKEKVIVEAFLRGNRKEETANKHWTSAPQEPGYYVQFGLECQFTVFCLDLATLVLLVRGQQSQTILAGRAVPLRHLRQGLRTVYLMGANFKESVNSYLLVHCQRGDVPKKTVAFLEGRS